MQQPEGFTELGEENLVCHIHKSLYGLKQASRTWNKVVTTCVLDYNFKQSEADPCVFTLEEKDTYTIATF